MPHTQFTAPSQLPNIPTAPSTANSTVRRLAQRLLDGEALINNRRDAGLDTDALETYWDSLYRRYLLLLETRR